MSMNIMHHCLVSKRLSHHSVNTNRYLAKEPSVEHGANEYERVDKIRSFVVYTPSTDSPDSKYRTSNCDNVHAAVLCGEFSGEAGTFAVPSASRTRLRTHPRKWLMYIMAKISLIIGKAVDCAIESISILFNKDHVPFARYRRNMRRIRKHRNSNLYVDIAWWSTTGGMASMSSKGITEMKSKMKSYDEMYVARNKLKRMRLSCLSTKLVVQRLAISKRAKTSST